MQYRDLIFDLYGTLVDIHTEEDGNVWEKTALYLGYFGVHYTASALEEAFRALLRSKEAAEGQSYECWPDIPFEEVLQQLIPETAVPGGSAGLALQAARLFRVCSTDYIRLYPHVPQALALLREKGCRLWLLSNAQAAFTAPELRHLQLDTAFDGIFLSSDYRCRKPDIRFFRALTDQQGLDPGKCLFIGNDRNTDIAGAQNAGMATLYMHTDLTPGDQAPADPAFHPKSCGRGCRHYEYEGSNWQELVQLLIQL